MKPQRVALVLALLVAGVGSRSALAGLITVNFSGRIDQVYDNDGLLTGSVTSHSAFSGSYTYDDQTADNASGDATRGSYSYLSFVLEVGSLTIDSAAVTGTGDKTINIFDEYASRPEDLYSTSFADTGGKTIEFGDLLFNQGFFSLVSTDLTTFADDSLITPPPLSQFDAGRVFRLGGFDLATQTSSFVITGTVEQISAAEQSAVPEPSSLVLLGIGAISLCGCRLRRSRRRQERHSTTDNPERPVKHSGERQQ